MPVASPAGRAITDTAVAMIDAEINRQTLMIAYIDDFYLMMIVSLSAIPLLLLLRGGRGARQGVIQGD